MHWFIEGGPAMYGLLCCALLGNPLGLAALAGAFLAKSKGLRIGLGSVSIAVALATTLIGVAGYTYAMSRVDSAIPLVEPDMRPVLMAAGREQAMTNLYFGCCGSLLPLLLGAVALVRGILTKPAEDAAG